MKRFEPTVEYGQESLRGHVLDKALEARAALGPEIGYAQILELLADGRFVRYPVSLVFDSAPLQSGEFGWAQPVGEHPSEGFRMVIHPAFQEQQQALPLLIAYHLVVINYGEIVTNEEAELYGAALNGLEVEDYYQRLCALADQLA